MDKILYFYKEIDPNLIAAIISAITTIVVLLLTGLGKLLYYRYSLNYKLKKEFNFEQKKKIKEEISKTKIKLLNSAEELNFRLWNFSSNIDKKWHNIPEMFWKETDNYYFHSFVYRILVFLYYIFATEKLVQTYDSTLFSKNDTDIHYLKYIKTFKNYLCDLIMLKEFDYSGEYATNHFFRDSLSDETFFILNNNRVIAYNEFLEKIKIDYKPISGMLRYISIIEKNNNNINYNVIIGLHILIIVFLNKYGHDYQKTNIHKINGLIEDRYINMKNINGFTKYLARCKIYKDFIPFIKIFYNHRIPKTILKDNYINSKST